MGLRDYIGKGKLFECAFVINCKSRKDRYDHVYKELKKAGIDDVVEYFPAIVHKFGMIGCSLSHLECVKIAKQRGCESVLIFEDDIVLTEHYEANYQKALDQLPTVKWDIFHFGAMLMNIAKLERPNLMQIGYNWAAHAVAIHKNAFDDIINKYDTSYSETDHSKPWGGHYPFDGFINKELFDMGYKIYTAYPLLITQMPNFSDTWGYHRDYRDLIEDSYETQIVRAEVNVLVCSKNRPMQLHALLKSFFSFHQCKGKPEVTVVYKADAPFKKGYACLKVLYPEVRFVEESDFFAQYKDVITKKAFTLFLVDDTVFYKPFKISEGCAVLTSDSNVLSFSYRLGSNTHYSYINNVGFQIPTEYDTTETVVKVDWTKQPEFIDFGYPFEISSSLYRSSDLVKLFQLQAVGWGNPNYFELTGTLLVRQHREQFGHYISTYRNSVAVSLALNRVNSVHLNRCGESPEYSPEALVRKFVEGFELDLSQMNDKWSSNSVHSELQLPFRMR